MSCVFFFSSRRRHTRLQGDWSSDVCSSDLLGRSTRRDGKRPGGSAREICGGRPQGVARTRFWIGRAGGGGRGWSSGGAASLKKKKKERLQALAPTLRPREQ